MSNLQNFNNIHADLAESAYNDRPNSFEDQDLKDGPADIDYSKDFDKKADKEKGTKAIHVDGGENLPNGGAVYLQPDETLHQEPVLPPVNYQKGLLTDERGAAVLDGFYQEATDNDN